MYKFIRAFAPATVANVACAFDILGFAVETPGDEVIVERTDKKGEIVIKEITGDGRVLPKNIDKNTATVALKAFLKTTGADFGLNVSINKMMPLGSGMGSSAASAAAALCAANEFLINPLPRQDLIPFAMESEACACGSAHADNAAPSILGGFVLIRSYEPLDIIKLPTPDKLFCSLVHPSMKLNTADSRHIIKQDVDLKSAVKQWGNIAGLISGLYSNDYALIGRSLKDYIFEPVRSFVIPAFNEVKQAGLKAGALGCSISGSGPSLFALSTEVEQAKVIAHAMQLAFSKVNIESEIYVSKINTEGTRILERK